MKARRYNKGKLRYSLIPIEALSKIADVYTKGAHKYTVYEKDGQEFLGKDIPLDQVHSYNIKDDGADNWKLGQEWLSSMESIERHIAAWKNGEDIDTDLNTYHLANAAWGMMSLLTYYDTHPELDNRLHWFKRKHKNLFLDIDGVIADFEQHFLQYLRLPLDHPTDWNDYRFREYFKDVADDNNFWVTMPRIIDPATIDYPIAGYCTARPCSEEIISIWLKRNNFPQATIINVGSDTSKVSALQQYQNVIMVDDSIKNFIELQSNGILCYLMTRPHNVKYNVGHFRVDNMNDFINKLKTLS